MNQELLRIVDRIARDKNIDTESIFVDLEEAMVSAARKHFGEPDSNIRVHIDRTTGEITAFKDDVQIDIRQLGRIPAQTAKQVMIQKIRADERDSIYAEFIQRKGQIISGSVLRYESGTLIVDLNHRTEAFMPKSEQIMGQTHRPGERIRSLILNVKEVANQVKIILSRTHPDFIHRLFELEVPEIAENIIEIRALAREAGYRTKVAVASLDDKDILTPDEYNQGIEQLTNCVKRVEDADDTVVDKLIALGVISVLDLEDVGTEPLTNELKIDAKIAEKLVEALIVFVRC